ncbi:MAG TPA: GNAT family N-acetyltransferase [Actinomycetales bacterium]|nr:GNAT family N-acetyltransferase [Actinomycetales bacterium]
MRSGEGLDAGSGRVETRPASDEIWDDVTRVFGTRGDPARCWCQWFRLRNDAWRTATTASNRESLKAQVEDASSGAAPPPGLVAYLDGEPVGWVALAPRRAYPRVLASNVMRAARKAGVAGEDDEPPVWAITCFVVRTGFRRQGIAGRMLEAAVEFAREQGADVVEAYPVDVASKAGVSSAELYHGTLALFRRNGFEEVARSGAARPVVRLQLA